MDIERFDQSARSMARTRSRRRLLGGTAIAIATATGLSKPALACKKVGKKCDKDKDCCDGARCKGDKKGQKGKCTCENRFTKCDRQCLDLSEDDQNCGACGRVCEFGHVCSDGDCHRI